MRFAWMMASTAAAAVAWTATPVHAQRPTEGGIFSYDASDVLDYWEEPTGTVRVHFSVSGPNVTVLDDSDGDGIPDYPQLVATTTLAVFDFYENDRGFRGPVREVDIGLGEPGGSPAFDVYLVDFGGNADGSFGIDDCLDTPVIRCAGYFSMENDFLGYNYPSLEYATNVLASHELFHAVQAAYTIGLPVWFSEGTATWAAWTRRPRVRRSPRERRCHPGLTRRLTHRSTTAAVRSASRPPISQAGCCRSSCCSARWHYAAAPRFTA